MLRSADSEHPKLISHEIIFEVFTGVGLLLKIVVGIH